MKVLFPTDFSEVSFKALKFAVEICSRFDGELVILHSLIKLKSHFIEADERHEENFQRVKGAEESIDKISGYILDMNPALKFDSYIIEGTPVESTLEARGADGVDLVVMGTTGAKGLTAIFGSTTGNVLQKTNAPLLVIPEDANFKGMFKTISFASRLEKSEYPYLEKIFTIKEKLEARLEILHVVNSEPDKDLENKGKVFIDNFKEDTSGIKINYLKGDDISETLDDYMSRCDDNLLVLMKRRTTIVEKIFNENVTKDMTLYGTSPLLIFPSS